MGKRKMWKLVRRTLKKELRPIRKDLRYHILRTDIIEKKVSSVWYKGALGLAFLGGAFSAAKSFLALFAS